jgi:uncharacterized pyridoxal phosphate-containing UPF0001 family protein
MQNYHVVHSMDAATYAKVLKKQRESPNKLTQHEALIAVRRDEDAERRSNKQLNQATTSTTKKNTPK